VKGPGLACRLSLLFLAGSSLVLGGVVAYNYRSARLTIAANAEEHARNVAGATVGRVEAVLGPIQKIPEGLASFLESGSFDQDDLVDLLCTTVERNPDIYGATIAYEPKAFDGRSASFAPYCKRSRGKAALQIGGDSARYFTMDWYQIPRETERPAWTEPYFDVGGGDIPMVSYGVPFYRNIAGERRLAGVVDVDVSLEWLEKIVSSVRILDSGYAFLITRNGMFVTHPSPSLVMNETLFSIAEGSGQPDLRQIGRDMVRGRSGFVTTNCLLSDRSCFLDYAPVPANGWSLGVLFPADELYADIRHLTEHVLGRAAVGLLMLLLIVVWMARSITRPLVALAGAAEGLARGELDTPVPAVRARDEVGRLASAFAHMQHELQRTIADLRKTSAERERAAAALEEHAHTLEQKIAERTQDLSAKNQELEATLGRLRETQQQLVVQEKLASLGALTAGIAHEIKNPLNFVSNFAQLSAGLLGEVRDELEANRAKLEPQTVTNLEELLADLEQNLARIGEHGKRADGIVRSMLQHSRGGARVREPSDLNVMVAESLNLAYHGMRAQDSKFNVRIETSFDPAVGTVSVVPQEVSRVFLNLVNNACWAAYEKKKERGDSFVPTVSAATKSLGGRVEVRIRDNGNGIPDAVRDKLFHPFFTTKPTGSGTGLGLSISREIVVQEHRGELRAESRPGEYAEFIVVLPRS
jgi:signal transduction histidine kinase